MSEKQQVYNLYDADMHAEIARSTCKKMLSLMDAKLGTMYKTLTIWAAKLSAYTVYSDIPFKLTTHHTVPTNTST